VIPMTTATFDIMGVDERSAAQRVELTVLREFGLLFGRMAGVAAYLLVVQWRTTEPLSLLSWLFWGLFLLSVQ